MASNPSSVCPFAERSHFGLRGGYTPLNGQQPIINMSFADRSGSGLTGGYSPLNGQLPIINMSFADSSSSGLTGLTQELVVGYSVLTGQQTLIKMSLLCLQVWPWTGWWVPCTGRTAPTLTSRCHGRTVASSRF